MEVYTRLGLSEEDYNTALFEIGYSVAEKHYSPITATRVRGEKMYWRWLENQREIVNSAFAKLLEEQSLLRGSQKSLNIYREMLSVHLGSVHLSEHLERKLIQRR